MTVQELLSVAWCDAVEIIVRENGDSRWIYAYKCGLNVQVGRYDYIRDKDGVLRESGRFFIPEKKVEVCRVDGHCRMLVIPKSLKNLPKEAQELEISHFRYAYITRSTENGLEITCYPKGWTPPEIPKVVEEVNERQYSLFDTEEGAET